MGASLAGFGWLVSISTAIARAQCLFQVCGHLDSGCAGYCCGRARVQPLHPAKSEAGRGRLCVCVLGGGSGQAVSMIPCAFTGPTVCSWPCRLECACAKLSSSASVLLLAPQFTLPSILNPWNQQALRLKRDWCWLGHWCRKGLQSVLVPLWHAVLLLWGVRV